jgi:hypothetical protein
MSGSPAKIVEADEFIDSLKKLKRALARPQYDSLIRTLAREATSLSDQHAALPQQDPAYPDEPGTRVHALVTGFVLIYSYLRETEDAPPRILLKSVLPV